MGLLLVSSVQASCFVGVHIPCIAAESRSNCRLRLYKSMKASVNIFASMKLVKNCIYDYLRVIGLLISMDGAWAFEGVVLISRDDDSMCVDGASVCLDCG
jgi:hypothetical protein